MLCPDRWEEEGFRGGQQASGHREGGGGAEEGHPATPPVPSGARERLGYCDGASAASAGSTSSSSASPSPPVKGGPAMTAVASATLAFSIPMLVFGPYLLITERSTLDAQTKAAWTLSTRPLPGGGALTLERRF